MKNLIILIILLAVLVLFSGCTTGTKTCTIENAVEYKSDLATSRGECFSICKGYGEGWQSEPEFANIPIGVFYNCNCYKCGAIQ